MWLGSQDPGGWGRGGGKIGTGETPGKGLRGWDGVARQGGGRKRGREKVQRKRGRGTRTGGCCCAGALGRAREGAQGLARAHQRGRREKPELIRGCPVAGFAPSLLPYPQAVPAKTSGPASILFANGQSHPKTDVQKSFGLETGSPIGSRESRGWPGSSSSEFPKAPTLGRGFRYCQSGHGICWNQQRAELVQQQD